MMARMCGLYSITTNPEAIRRLFRVTGALPNWPPRYKVAPTEAVPVIEETEGARVLLNARWGLVPSWSKAIGTRPLINARAETIASAAPFRAAFRRRRCLVPADGFFEWVAAEQGAKAPKQPYFIHAGDREPFAMAGLLETWSPPEGPPLLSTTIITCPANAVVAPLHDRMPVILEPDAVDLWLDRATPGEALQALLVPAPDQRLAAYAVRPGIHARAADDPAITAPLDAAPDAPPDRQYTLL